VFTVALCCAQGTSAQQAPAAQQPPPESRQPQPPPQQPGVQQGSAQPRPTQGAAAAQPEPVEGTTLSTTDHSPESQEPQPPNQVDVEELQSTERAEVSLGAGEGSTVAYASATVVELGGSLALTHASETTTFRIAPSVGYFVVDNIELTLFPDLTILHVGGDEGGGEGDGATDVTFGAMLEPSYHMPFNDDLFGFLGVGFGLRYADDPGVDFALRPRLGMDIMVGRSGILKPAVFLDIGANDGLTQGGFEAGFTVML
jgi:hypothetical protein